MIIRVTTQQSHQLHAGFPQISLQTWSSKEPRQHKQLSVHPSLHTSEASGWFHWAVKPYFHLLPQFLLLARVGRAWINCSQEHTVMERRKRREECFEGGYFVLTQPTVPPNNSTKGAGSWDSETWNLSVSPGSHVLASERHADDTAKTWGHNFINQRKSHPETLTSLQDGDPAPRCKETAPNPGNDNLLQAPWGLTSVTTFLDCQQQELEEPWMTFPKHTWASACIHFQHHYCPCSSSNILTPQLSNSADSQAPWIFPSRIHREGMNACRLHAVQNRLKEYSSLFQRTSWPPSQQGQQLFGSNSKSKFTG